LGPYISRFAPQGTNVTALFDNGKLTPGPVKVIPAVVSAIPFTANSENEE